MNADQLPRETDGNNRLTHLLLWVLLYMFAGATYGISNAYSAGNHSDESNLFEGRMTVSRYVVSSDGNEERVSRTPLLIHRDFILVQRSEAGGVDLIGNIKAESILVRQRTEDFVFFTSDQQAVIMNKQELQQMINMLESMRGAGSQSSFESPEITLEETAEQKNIQGYPSRKWIIKTEGSPAEWHVWATEELSIAWGMLAESWLTRHTFLYDLPTDDWLDDNRLPVQAELWNGGQLAEILRFEEIAHQSMDESHFRIPEGYQRVNFQQMLFNRMRNR